MRVNAIFAAKGVCPRPLVTPFAPASAATDRSLLFFYIAGRFIRMSEITAPKYWYFSLSADSVCALIRRRSLRCAVGRRVIFKANRQVRAELHGWRVAHSLLKRTAEKKNGG
jgi:hypothetical protein